MTLYNSHDNFSFSFQAQWMRKSQVYATWKCPSRIQGRVLSFWDFYSYTMVVSIRQYSGTEIWWPMYVIPTTEDAPMHKDF